MPNEVMEVSGDRKSVSFSVDAFWRHIRALL